MNNFIEINGRKIGDNFPPYIIAEMSANHNGDINNAYKIIDMAKSSGADCIKIQTYTPDMMTIKENVINFKIKKGLWKGYTLWDLYNLGQTPLSWHKSLFKHAKDKKIKIFSTPFSEEAIDFLEKLTQLLLIELKEELSITQTILPMKPKPFPLELKNL